MIIDKLRFVALAVAFSVSIPVVAQEITITDNCIFTKAVIDDQEKSILAVDGVPAFEIATRISSSKAI